MIRVGIVGYGMSARMFHLPLLRTSGEFEIVAISTSQADAVRSAYPAVRAESDASCLIASDDVDLVIITAPNTRHFDLARLSLEQGRHVVLEKPMVTSSEQGKLLAAMARDSSTTLSVFHNRRWDGDFLTASKLIAENAVGEVRSFESRFDRFRPRVQNRWREQPGPGAGVWWDLGPHLADQALCLFGQPEALTARLLIQREDATVTDHFHVVLHYDDKEILLHASSLAAGPNLRFRLDGTRGSYLKYGLDPQEGQVSQGLLPGANGYGVESSERYGTLYTEEGSERVETEAGCYQQFYRELANAIANGTAPPVMAEDGIAVIELMELAEQSHREGRTMMVQGADRA